MLSFLLSVVHYPRLISYKHVLYCKTHEREREGDLYFSVVTGTCYGTKTPTTWPAAYESVRRGYNMRGCTYNMVYRYGL